jgi:hypothetical protein
MAECRKNIVTFTSPGVTKRYPLLSRIVTRVTSRDAHIGANIARRYGDAEKVL